MAGGGGPGAAAAACRLDVEGTPENTKIPTSNQVINAVRAKIDDMIPVLAQGVVDYVRKELLITMETALGVDLDVTSVDREFNTGLYQETIQKPLEQNQLRSLLEVRANHIYRTAGELIEASGWKVEYTDGIRSQKIDGPIWDEYPGLIIRSKEGQ